MSSLFQHRNYIRYIKRMILFLQDSFSAFAYFVFFINVSYNFTRIPLCNYIRWYIFSDNTTCANYSLIPYRYSRKQNSTSFNPNILTCGYTLYFSYVLLGLKNDRMYKFVYRDQSLYRHLCE